VESGVIGVMRAVVSVALSVVAGILGGVLYERHQTQPLRIVVLDMRTLAESVARDTTLSDAARAERVAQLGAAVNRSVGQYVRQGAIVLDGTAVLRAPKELYVEP
jgi:hypothetical protein